MKSLSFISAIFLLFAPIPSFARDIIIRSGEHDGFSRLVFYTTTNEQLLVSQDGNSYTVGSANPEDKFVTTGIFDLIPRTRIKNITETPNNRILIELDCDCEVTNTKIKTGQVVFDVSNSEPITGPIVPLPATPIIVKPNDLAKPKAPMASGSPLSARRGLPIPGLQSQPPFPTAKNALPKPADPLHDHDDQHDHHEAIHPMAKDHLDPRFSEGSLLTRLSRAASLGLVTPKPGSNVGAPTPKVNDALPKVPSPLIPIPTNASKVTETDAPHISIETSVDSAFTALTNSMKNDTIPTCPDPQLFDIGAWGTIENDKLNFSAYKSGLLEEFDRPNQEATIKYIQNLLFLTLGAEAIASVEAFELNEPYKTAFTLLGQIVENKEAKQPKILSRFLHCPEPTSFWAALAKPIDPNNTDVNKTAILKTMAALPPHLRKYLGPTLAQRFNQSQDHASATALAKMMERAGGVQSSSQLIVEAELDLESGNIEAANETLTTVIENDDDQSPKALIKLINTNISKNLGISQKTIELAEAFAFERKNTEMGDSLYRALVRAEFHAGDFPKAFAALDALNFTDESATATKSMILDEAIKRLTESASDSVFLTYSFARDDITQLPDKTKSKVADRLLSLGFGKKAKALLDPNQAIPDSNSSFLIAKAALDENKPEISLGLLAGLTGDEAEMLRAKALEQSGQTAQAAEIYKSLGDLTKANETYWRTKDWESIANNIGLDGATDAAQTIIENGLDQKAMSPPISLADHEELINQSTKLRDATAKLLLETTRP